MCDAVAGKIALITGSSFGIGAAYVKELFQRGLRACTMTDIDPKGVELADDMNCKYGKGKAIFIKADSAQKGALECVFQEAIKEYKGVDIVVNNAGILRDAVWEDMVDLNIKATVRGSLLGIKYMSKHCGGKGGIIVNTASIVGLQPLVGMPVYCGTKHFVIGFDRSMGSPYYYDLTGIKFLTICPGVTSTGMISDASQHVWKGFPCLGEYVNNELGSLPSQSSECLAQGFATTMLNEGKTGSIWVGEGGEIYEVQVPDRRTMRKKKNECSN